MGFDFKQEGNKIFRFIFSVYYIFSACHKCQWLVHEHGICLELFSFVHVDDISRYQFEKNTNDMLTLQYHCYLIMKYNKICFTKWKCYSENKQRWLLTWNQKLWLNVLNMMNNQRINNSMKAVKKQQEIG